MKAQKKFWTWNNQAGPESERVLELYGTIAEASWFDDDVTPKMFHDELFSGSGPVTIFLNSPGGDCIAASQIYTMLMDYAGDVTVKIDGIAASAASVIAMAGTKVLMAPTALMMIHNPMTAAYGNHADMEKAIEMLDEVKESIINAYELRTGLSRAKLSHLMDSETWMNAYKAIELGFADGILEDDKRTAAEMPAYAFSGRETATRLLNKLEAHFRPKTAETEQPAIAGSPIDELKTAQSDQALRRAFVMSKMNELRTQRAKAWEQAKAFLDSHRNDKGILSAEDTQAYERMEQEIVDLGHEIERQERLDAMEREMAQPVTVPITAKPENTRRDEKVGRAADSYQQAFWAQVRAKDGVSYEIRNALSEGVDTEGGYLVPDEFEHTLIQALEEDSVVRAHAHVFTTSNGVHKIPVVATKGVANWIDENGAYGESDDVFGQEQIDAHKVGTIIKVSEELLNDSAFSLEQYFTAEFARRIGAKEEEAFLIGDGSKKPTGILNTTGGADVGVTAASATAITADELIDLYYSLKAPYRKNAIWILNDATVRAIRKLKDGNGQYLWQPGLREGDADTLLGKQIFTSAYAPTLSAGAKTILFGDLSYYWIGDRQGVTFKRLNERYADYGQVGFLASKRVDGKLILSEAIKVLQQKSASGT